MARKPVLSITEIETGVASPKKEHARELPKEFVATRQPNGLYMLSFTAGGEVPALLKGHFTSGVKAEQMAKSYLLSKRASPTS